MRQGWCIELFGVKSPVLILGQEEPHPTKKSRVGKLHFRDDPVLVEKEMTVADPSATDIPQYYSCCHQRVYLSDSGVQCLVHPELWGTPTKMLLPSSYCKWRKVPRCLWTGLSTTTPSRSRRWWSWLATTTSRWTRSPTYRRRPLILRPTRGRGRNIARLDKPNYYVG